MSHAPVKDLAQGANVKHMSGSLFVISQSTFHESQKLWLYTVPHNNLYPRATLLIQPTYTGNSHVHMLTTLPLAVTVTTLQLL